MNPNRRGFLKQALLAVTALPFLKTGLSVLAPAAAEAADKKKGAAKKQAPLPAGATEAAQTDPVVQAIGYKPDVKDVDYAKYPQRKKPDAKDQFCKTCALYTAQNDGWGKCQLISTGLVNANGWCGSWSKKS